MGGASRQRLADERDRLPPAPGRPAAGGVVAVGQQQDAGVQDLLGGSRAVAGQVGQPGVLLLGQADLMLANRGSARGGDLLAIPGQTGPQTILG